MTAHCERLATFLRQRPGVWIDGRSLGELGGAYAWRTRVSELRRPPFNMTIENRLRRVRLDGRAFVVSEYRFVPRAGQQELFDRDRREVSP